MLEFLQGIPSYQIYFIISQLFALIYGLLFRQFLLYQQTKCGKKLQKNIIYLLSFVPGLIIAYFCFGKQIIHLVSLTLLCYSVLLIFERKWIHLVTFVLSLLYLSFVHFNRLLYEDTSIYQLEISAPLMVLVQKTTSIAFFLYDSFSVDKSESKTKKDNLDSRYCHNLPTFLQYCSYMFNFQTIICGPLIFFPDYEAYLAGDILKKHNLNSYPPVWKICLKQFGICLLCGLFSVYLAPLFAVSHLQNETFYHRSFFVKLFLLYMISLVNRIKYYFAWVFVECICNLSGLGFSGIDSKTNIAKYDRATGIHIYEFEMALSQRDALAVWNITTTKWLRYVSNDRVPKPYKVGATFLLSAFWHGFYPGYYITFMTGLLFTLASRTARKCLRYRFADDKYSLIFYHFLTWIITRLMIAYLSFPFILLNFYDSIKVYQSLYWFGHVVAIFLYILLPLMFPPQQTLITTTESDLFPKKQKH